MNGAVVAAAIANATRASGVIVHVDPQDFLRVLARSHEPLVVHSSPGFFSRSDAYLTSYKGLAFFTKSRPPLDLPAGTEIVHAKTIWIPG